MKSSGVLWFALILAVAWLYLGISALADGRTLQGVLGLVLAGAFAGWGIGTVRKRRDAERERRLRP